MSLSLLFAYPVALLSTLAFYAIAVALMIPASRRLIAPLFVAAPTPNQQHLAALDCFRGFAASLVAMAHCWWASHPIFHSTQLQFPWLGYGAKAVPIFAVLSGFLIYRSALSITSLADVRAYIVRRFFRIYPVYVLSVILCLVTGQYVANTSTTASGYFIADLFMLNVLSWPGGFANPVTWSLYVEVAFYAALPLALITLGQKRMLAFAAVGIVVLVAADYPSRVFGLWKFFLMGIAASELSERSRPVAVPVVLAGLALLILDFASPANDWAAAIGLVKSHSDGETLGLGIGVGAVLAAIPHWSALSKWLDVLPLRILGSISYSVYIVHFFYILANFPVIGRFTQAGTQGMYEIMKAQPQLPWWYLPFLFFPGVLVWAMVSYVLIEKPGMQMGSWLAARLKRQRAAATVS